MKLGDICPAECFENAGGFEIPPPGCDALGLKFASECGRDYFAVLLRNQEIAWPAEFDPRVAIVGLSPASNQISAFVRSYARTRNYGAASVEGAFAELAPDIIRMMQGLGLSEKLSMTFTSRSLDRHPEVLVTSLVACASLTTEGKSDDFDPGIYPAAVRCITKRFVPEILNPRFHNLRVVLILGSKGWKAVHQLKTSPELSVAEAIRRNGKLLLNLPHPSGQNGEYVKLASMTHAQFPKAQDYVRECWSEYATRPPRPGRRKQSEDEYKAKRLSYWSTVKQLRDQIAELEI